MSRANVVSEKIRSNKKLRERIEKTKKINIDDISSFLGEKEKLKTTYFNTKDNSIKELVILFYNRRWRR
jgi:hypothetical protein